MMRTLSLPFVMLSLLVGAVSTGCSKRVQETALHKYALDLCDKMPHKSGNSCPSEVERNFPQCSPSFLAKESSSEAFTECLGFVLPPRSSDSTIIGQCDTPHISARISVTLAKNAPWENSLLRELNGEKLYVSNTPTISTGDLRSLRLEEGGGERTIVVEISPDAARRLEQITRSNIGNSMVLVLNDSVVAPKIVSAISGPKLVLEAPGARLEDVCRKP